MTSAACTGLFAELLGQERAVALLEASLRRGRLAPAYLFTGPEGVGRTLAALRFLEGVLAGPAGSAAIRRRLVQGNHPDLLRLEPTYQHQGRLVPVSRALEEGVNRRNRPQIRLEQVRAASRFLAGHAVEGDRCLLLLEGAEAMAEAAANALLKTLEEPGEGILILISAAPEQLLATIRSRCQIIPFTRLSPSLMAVALQSSDAELADPPELLELAAGSPGALLAIRREWQALPRGLAERLLTLPPDPLEALSLARDLCEALDGEQQLWLLDWWQLALWRRGTGVSRLRRIERLRGHLRSYVQPRLAWEVTLVELAGPAVARR